MDKGAVYLFGFAKGANLPLTMRAVTFADKLHKGQVRDNGEPYAKHPFQVCRTMLNHNDHKLLGDSLLAAALLHDVLENTEETEESLAALFGEQVASYVAKVTKTKDKELAKTKEYKEQYYGVIAQDVKLVMLKACDRVCNIADMVEIFATDRLERYVEETETYIIPMMKNARREHLEYSDAFIALRDHMKGIIKAVKEVIRLRREIEKLKSA